MGALVVTLNPWIRQKPAMRPRSPWAARAEFGIVVSVVVLTIELALERKRVERLEN
jgi:hypothetical protein